MHKICQAFFFTISVLSIQITLTAQTTNDTISVVKDTSNVTIVNDTSTDTLPGSKSTDQIIDIKRSNGGKPTGSNDTSQISVTALGVTKDTIPSSVNVDLEQIFNAKTPKEYIISDIKVSGAKSFDQSLIISITGLAVGDKVIIPGADNFSKAINNLWKQNLISNVEIYFTKLVDKNLSVEINITERPRLSGYKFRGIKKGESEDLEAKTGLVKGRVVTENMKRSAVDNIQKYYVDKGFRNIEVKAREEKDLTAPNAVLMTFLIDKKGKVKINEINFAGNDNVPDPKLKKQMKGTKEMSRFTLFPP
ncbi:MAG: hypothetical protein H0V14_11685, partial [Chitinophagaceae bacterium]|nr:hypothetical protein [Chitinophagaceae bacterium]